MPTTYDPTSATSWQLARLAECADPDAHDGYGFDDPPDPRPEGSPGAQFLRAVAHGVADHLAEGDDDDPSDAAHEIADSAVPIYTHERWQVFTDLAAYQEDPSELGAAADDLTAAAGTCLYIVARRLAEALIEAERSSDEDDDD
jgi:hypothetical protein